MTKVQVHYQLTRPLDDTLLEAINRTHAVYGMQRVQVSNTGDAITVEYDASRLTPTDVDNALRGSGLPVVRN